MGMLQSRLDNNNNSEADRPAVLLFACAAHVHAALQQDHRTRGYVHPTLAGLSPLQASEQVSAALRHSRKAPDTSLEVPESSPQRDLNTHTWLRAHSVPPPFSVLHPAAWRCSDVCAWIESFGAWCAPLVRCAAERSVDGASLENADAAAITTLLATSHLGRSLPSARMAACLVQDLRSCVAACERAEVPAHAGKRAQPLYQVHRSCPLEQLSLDAAQQALCALSGALWRDEFSSGSVPFAVAIDALQVWGLDAADSWILVSQLPRDGLLATWALHNDWMMRMRCCAAEKADCEAPLDMAQQQHSDKVALAA